MRIWLILWFIASVFAVSKSLANPTGEYFDQKIDPSNTADHRTFQQRFIVDSTSADGTDSPVLYYICGEANCFDQPNQALPYPPLVQYEASQFHSYVVVLEHRYFGKSQPFDDMTVDNLKYLTFENAIEDLANFQRYVMNNRKLTGKWISIGGSYAGALSAYYRLKHPELVKGAWASSAPVQAKENLEEFDYFTAKRLGSTCVANLQNAFGKIEVAGKDPAQLSLITKQFGVNDVSDVADFIGLPGALGSMAVQFGAVTAFCQLIDSADPISGLAIFSNAILNALEITPEAVSRGPMATKASLYENGVGLRPWEYMTCSEFGYFTVAYHDPTWSARPSAITLKSAENNCKALFGISNFDKIDEINKAFYQALLMPSTSNILFTNGADDPWSTLSISHELGNDTNPNVQVYTIQGASHTFDLNSKPDPKNSASLNDAIQLITHSIGNWLKD